MSQSIKFPTTIHGVSDYFEISIPYISVLAVQTRLGITAPKLKVVTDVKALFDPNRKKYLDPSQCTQFVIRDNNLYISQMKVGMDSIVADIPNSSLTDDDKNILLIIEKRHVIIYFCPFWI